MGNKILLTICALILIFFPSVVLAENEEENDEKDEKLDVDGEVNVDSLHFSASDNSYILVGLAEITNKSKKDIKDDLFIVIEFPEGAGPEIGEVDPVKIEGIKAGKTAEQDFEMFIKRSEVGANREATFSVAIKEDDKLVKITELNGEADISVMKNTYSEIDAVLTGEIVKKDKEELSLKIRIEGQNHSIYPIKENDDIYLAFQLPYNLNIEIDKSPENVYKTSAGGAGEIIAMKFEANNEDHFTFEYEFPLTGELKESGLNNWNTSMLLLQRIPNDPREFLPAGSIEGEIDIDFTPLFAEEEEIEDEEEEEPEEVEKEEPEEKKQSFFNVSFFVGVFAGVSIAFLPILVIWLIRRTQYEQ